MEADHILVLVPPKAKRFFSSLTLYDIKSRREIVKGRDLGVIHGSYDKVLDLVSKVQGPMLKASSRPLVSLA
jgi:hypothetical protein